MVIGNFDGIVIQLVEYTIPDPPVKSGETFTRCIISVRNRGLKTGPLSLWITIMEIGSDYGPYWTAEISRAYGKTPTVSSERDYYRYLDAISIPLAQAINIIKKDEDRQGSDKEGR